MKIVLLIIFALTLEGCVVQESVYVKEGKEYGVTGGLFRHQWWNYYERGLSYADGEFYEEAVKDLKTAIEKRRNDRWRSRTYGMHIVDYFPHRELGIIYYKIKRYADAERELEESLKTAGSAKAKYFLNKTRKSILDQTGEDKLPPSIKIDYPSDETVTNRSTITLIGQAEDDYYVSSLLINLTPVPVELSAKKVKLKQEIALKRGVNELRILAADLTGKETEKILKIHSDREGPVIIIEDQVINGRKIILTGFITDSTRIRSFIANGQPVPLHYETDQIQKSASDASGQELAFHQEIYLPEGIDTIMLAAEDTAMNVTKGEVHVSLSNSRQGHLPLLAASRPVRAGMGHDEYAFIGSGLGKLIDDIPPEIHLRDLADLQIVYYDSLFLEGSVSDGSKIESLMINGESVLKRKGKKVFFNYLAELREGRNGFLIEAADIFGNKSEKVVTVIRQIPKIRNIGSRMSISFLPLESKGQRSIAGDAILDSLISAFVNQKRFQLIERERIKEILNELRLSQTELVEPGTASKIGKIAAADAMLIGTIYESKNAIEVFTRLVDTETSNIMDAQDVFNEDKSLQGMKTLMEGLALKYRQGFPLLEGFVIKKDGKAVLISLGEDNRIKINMGLVLFREGEEIADSISQKTPGSEPVELGEAKVENVYKEFSRAIIKKGQPAKVRIRDKIITK